MVVIGVNLSEKSNTQSNQYTTSAGIKKKPAANVSNITVNVTQHTKTVAIRIVADDEILDSTSTDVSRRV